MTLVYKTTNATSIITASNSLRHTRNLIVSDTKKKRKVLKGNCSKDKFPSSTAGVEPMTFQNTG